MSYLFYFGRSVGAGRPSVHRQVDVVSQKRKKVEWGITNELVRPSVGQVRSGGGEGRREGEAAPVGMYGHMSPVSVRPSSDVEGPQTATDDAEVQPALDIFSAFEKAASILYSYSLFSKSLNSERRSPSQSSFRSHPPI